jgi:anti-anti-sigma factor
LVESRVGSFQLSGELDTAAVPMAMERLSAANGDIALDCSCLTFIDAAGLRLFVAIHEQCEARGATLTIVNPSRCVIRLMEVTGLDSVLRCARGVSSR